MYTAEVETEDTSAWSCWHPIKTEDKSAWRLIAPNQDGATQTWHHVTYGRLESLIDGGGKAGSHGNGVGNSAHFIWPSTTFDPEEADAIFGRCGRDCKRSFIQLFRHGSVIIGVRDVGWGGGFRSLWWGSCVCVYIIWSNVTKVKIWGPRGW